MVTTFAATEAMLSDDIETTTIEDTTTFEDINSEIVTNHISENMSEIVTNHISENITETVINHISENITENITENINTVTTEPITHESLINELCEKYSEELSSNVLNIRDIIEIVNEFSVTDLPSSEVTELIISMIETII
jgi:hypothetical protein